MKKLLIITEEEKNNIRKLHNLNEQTSGSTEDKSFSSFIQKVIDRAKEKVSNIGKNTSTDNSTNNLSGGSGGDVDSKWMNVTKKVIDKFEGGYWNGSTSKNVKTSKMGICSNHPNGSMAASTETMFGLDRYNGDIEKSADGKLFFEIIDKQKKDLGMTEFCKKWKWLYRGGEYEDQLKTLAAKIMKTSYDRNAKAYFSPELKKRVESNDRLLMHFSYACWNGPVFFRNFAKSLEKSLSKSDNDLLAQAISDRKNTGLLRQEKVAAVLTDPNLNLA